MGPRLREIKDSVEPTRPPAPVTRWQPVVALIAGLLAVGGVLLAGGDLRWETRVHAQEIRDGQAASVAAAREECARSLDRTAGRTQRELADVRERLVRVEESLRWQGVLLEQLARRLGVVPSAAAASSPYSPPDPAPATAPTVQP